MSYAEDHASALADVSDAGAPITWSKTTPGTYDEATDTYTDTVTTSCPCAAVEDDGDPQEYRDLELIQSNPVTLFCTPLTYGDLPTLGMTGTWGGVSRTVKKIRAGGTRPDGNAIAFYVIAV